MKINIKILLWDAYLSLLWKYIFQLYATVEIETSVMVMHISVMEVEISVMEKKLPHRRGFQSSALECSVAVFCY